MCISNPIILIILQLTGTLCSSNYPPSKSPFDLSYFLDPQVQADLIPLPVPGPTYKKVVDPPLVDPEGQSERQISLVPTQAFITRRSINTSCAFTIPLIVFTLPTAAPYDSPAHTANQMVYSLFGIMYTVASFIVPVVFTGIRDPTITGRSENYHGEDPQPILGRLLQQQPMVDFMGTGNKQRVGLDPRNCLLKSVCVANRLSLSKEYDKMFVLPLQTFYPPPDNDSLAIGKVSPLQMAAKTGAYESNVDCSDMYPCFLDYLDAAVYLRQILIQYFGHTEKRQQ